MLSILATYWVLRWIFREELAEEVNRNQPSVPLTRQGALVLAGLAVMTVVLLIASALKWDLGLPTCLAAVGIAAVVLISSGGNPLSLVREVSWSTLGLVAGLFVLVRGVESHGALQWAQHGFAELQRLPPIQGATAAAFGVGIANNLVNNLPLGLLAGATLQSAHAHGLLANATMIGVDLGPNLSITGSLATILWLLALQKAAIKMSFWQFFKVGSIAMPLALLAALGGAFLFGL